MKSIWKDLLFLHGHITDPRILESAAPSPPDPGTVVSLPASRVRTAEIERDPAAFAKAWQECA